MSEDEIRTGGCLCGALRYEARGAPAFSGLCYCADCRRASGSAFVPFMGYSRDAVRLSGTTLRYSSPSARGSAAVRNSCPRCGSLVFGGHSETDDSFTIYAGSLDDPAGFRPTVAIFTRDRPHWASLPSGLASHPTMPGLDET